MKREHRRRSRGVDWEAASWQHVALLSKEAPNFMIFEGLLRPLHWVWEASYQRDTGPGVLRARGCHAGPTTPLLII